jgi:hypothetical protein
MFTTREVQRDEADDERFLDHTGRGGENAGERCCLSFHEQYSTYTSENLIATRCQCGFLRFSMAPQHQGYVMRYEKVQIRSVSR